MRSFVNRAGGFRLIISAVTAALSLLAASPEARAGKLDPATGAICSTTLVPVKLSPLSLFPHHVWAELCVPPNTARGTALVMVSGATYSHVYWDFPHDPDTYSFKRRALKAGYVTLNFDRIGIGESSRPLSPLVTLSSHAYVVAQLALALRSGALGYAAPRVALVGHSLGSVIAIGAAALYPSVDALVVTGYLHTFGLGLPMALPNVYPAALDPSFGSAGLDLGYLTTQPGTRSATFYYQNNLDPAVTAVDEATKATVTESELGELEVYGNQLVSQGLTMPVLSVVGRWDALFCMALPCLDALNAAILEPLAYSPAADLELVVVPESGHDMNLQKNAPLAFDSIIDWLGSRFPPAAP